MQIHGGNYGDLFLCSMGLMACLSQPDYERFTERKLGLDHNLDQSWVLYDQVQKLLFYTYSKFSVIT